MSTQFSSSLPGAFHAPISNKVVTIKFTTKRVKVTCDLEALFARRLVVGSKRSMELSTLFDFKLSPVHGCLRKGIKSVIVQRLGIIEANPPVPDAVLIDASQLI